MKEELKVKLKVKEKVFLELLEFELVIDLTTLITGLKIDLRSK